MKRIVIALIMAVMLTACGNTGTEVQTETTYAETPTETAIVTEAETTASAATTNKSETETTKPETTAAPVQTTTVTTTTAAPEKGLTLLTADELSGDTKRFFESANKVRAKEDIAGLSYAKELEGCAKSLNDTFTKADSFFTGYDTDDFCEDYFLENGIEYTDYEADYGLTFNYNVDLIFNVIFMDSNAYKNMTDTKWKYIGFYYDSDSLYWTIIYITDDYIPEKEYSTSGLDTYFDNSTAFNALNTYMSALANDDYYTYLAITLQEDSEDSREHFDYRKENYVGIDLRRIKYYETEINPLYGYADTTYKVVEFSSDGDYRFDINTFDDAYGTIRIDQASDGSYYVSAHIRYSVYFNIE